MSSRMRKPEAVRLEISRGDWLLVKKHLTAGENREMFKRMLDPNGSIEPTNVGLSKMVTYLIDWSILDSDNKPVVILDQSDRVKTDALNALDAEDSKELLKAIEDHERAMEAERAAEKNNRDGVTTSSPSSPSAELLGGDTNTLTTSPQMSIAS